MKRSAWSLLVVLCFSGACGGSTSTTPSPVTPTPTPTPPATQNSGPLTACTTLQSAGSYTLGADIGGSGASACIIIAVSGVSLDCAGHAAGGIGVQANLSNLTIKNCRLSAFLFLSGGSNNTIDHNTLTLSGSPPAGIYTVSLTNSQITNNTIDGGYHGSDFSGGGTDGPGADDGIVIGDAKTVTVTANTISNVFDAGIEGVNHVANSTIANNTITNAVFTGIGAYYCTAWDANTITGNVVSQSLSFIEGFVLTANLCSNFPNRPGLADFVGNIIKNNVMRNPIGNSNFGISLLFTPPAATAAGNVIQNNDMGMNGIAARPPEAFQDAGGNTCGPSGNFSC